MHAEIRWLIALRDGEVVDASVSGHVATCAVCRRRIDELNAARAALRAMPDVKPSAEVWSRIAGPRVARQRRRWQPINVLVAAAVGVAAAVPVFLLLGETRPSVPPVTSSVQLAQLMERSRELEYVLRSYPRRSVTSLRVVGTVADLEDGIALIDQQLSRASLDGNDDATALWEQRVTLMEALVTVKAAEHYIDSI